MAKGISIGIAADTKAFDQGVKKGIIEPLEDAAEVLEDLADEGKDSGKDLEKAMRNQQGTTEKLQREYRALGDEITDASRRGGKSMAVDLKAGTDSAAEGMDDLKGEAAQSAAETAASFDGSADSIAGMFQEVAANAFAGFGPAGMAAGIVAAAGIGLVISAIDTAGTNTEEFRQGVADLAGEFIEAGADGEVSLDLMIDKLKELAVETDQSKNSLKKIDDLAGDTRGSFKDLAAAFAGNSKELDRQIDLYRKVEKSSADAAEGADLSAKGEYQAAITRSEAAGKVITELEKVKAKTDAAAEAEALYIAAGGPGLAQKAAHIAALDEAYDGAAGAADDYLVKESGLFDTEAYITAMLQKEEALRNYQDTLAHSSLTPAAKTFLDSQGQEAAATFMQGYKDATPAQRTELGRIWDEAGDTSSGAYTRSLRAGIPNTIKGPTVSINPNTAGFDAAIARLRKIRLKIPVEGVNREGRIIV